MAGLGPWSLGPSPGLPAPGLGPGPDPAWDRAQGSPGLGPRLEGLCPAHVSALLTVYVCRFYAYVRFNTLNYLYVKLYFEYDKLVNISWGGFSAAEGAAEKRKGLLENFHIMKKA